MLQRVAALEVSLIGKLISQVNIYKWALVSRNRHQSQEQTLMTLWFTQDSMFQPEWDT